MGRARGSQSQGTLTPGRDQTDCARLKGAGGAGQMRNTLEADASSHTFTRSYASWHASLSRLSRPSRVMASPNLTYTRDGSFGRTKGETNCSFEFPPATTKQRPRAELTNETGAAQCFPRDGWRSKIVLLVSSFGRVLYFFFFQARGTNKFVYVLAQAQPTLPCKWIWGKPRRDLTREDVR